MRVGRGGPRRGFFERVCRGQQREGPEQNLLRALQEHRQEQEEQDDGEGGAVMQHNNSKMARNLTLIRRRRRLIAHIPLTLRSSNILKQEIGIVTGIAQPPTVS